MLKWYWQIVHKLSFTSYIIYLKVEIEKMNSILNSNRYLQWAYWFHRNNTLDFSFLMGAIILRERRAAIYNVVSIPPTMFFGLPWTYVHVNHFGVIYHTRSDLRCHPMCLLQRRWRLFSIELRELDFKLSYDREQRKLHWSSFTHHTAHVQRYCSWVSDEGGSKRRLFVCFQVMRMLYGLSSASLFSQGCPEGRE